MLVIPIAKQDRDGRKPGSGDRPKSSRDPAKAAPSFRRRLPTTATAPTEPGVAPESPALNATLGALAPEARAHYDRAIPAQRDGNWALYGDEIKKLGEVLEGMKAARSVLVRIELVWAGHGHDQWA